MDSVESGQGISFESGDIEMGGKYAVVFKALGLVIGVPGREK